MRGAGEGDPRGLLRPGASLRVEFVDGAGFHRCLDAVVASAERDLLLHCAAPPADRRAWLRPGQHAELWLDAPEERALVAAVVVTAQGGTELRTTWPRRLLAVGRRRYHRVPSGAAIWTSAGPGRLLDLGGGGCSIVLAVSRRGERALVLGSHLALQVPVGDDLLHVAARVTTLRRLDGRLAYGLTFEGLSERQRDILIREIVACERAALRQRARDADRAPS